MNDPQVSRRLQAAVRAAVVPLPGEAFEAPQFEDDQATPEAARKTAAEKQQPGAAPHRPSAPVVLEAQSAHAAPTAEPATVAPTAAAAPTTVNAHDSIDFPTPTPPSAGSRDPQAKASWEGNKVLGGAVAAALLFALGAWIVTRPSVPHSTAERTAVAARPTAVPRPQATPSNRLAPLTEAATPPSTPAAVTAAPKAVEVPRNENSTPRRDVNSDTDTPLAVGSIRIRSTPGARVFLNDTEYTSLGASGELTIVDVPAGAYSLRVRVGTQEVTLTATVVAGRETSLDANPAPTSTLPSAPPAPSTPEAVASAAPSITSPPLPAPDVSRVTPPAWTQAFEFAQWPWTQYVQVGPNELRYERKTSTGRVDPDSFVASCAEIEGVRPGSFGGGMSIRLKNGTKVDISRASRQQISQLQEALDRACSQR